MVELRGVGRKPQNYLTLRSIAKAAFAAESDEATMRCVSKGGSVEAVAILRDAALGAASQNEAQGSLP